MTTLIQQIGRLAFQIFKRESAALKCSEPNFKYKFDQLHTLLNTVKIEDLSIEPSFIEEIDGYDFEKQRSAPVVYIELYNELDLTVCIFILKSGVRLPLHDHPAMYGLLKVIYGTVQVQSYTLPLSVEDRHRVSGLYPVQKHPPVVVSPLDPACRLEPNEQNLHEVRAVGKGPAAFLDILSPPYGHDRISGFERVCHYYKEVEADLNVAQTESPLLMRVPSPVEFWCDSINYTGPPLYGYIENNS